MGDRTLAEEFAALNEAVRKSHEAIADMKTERRLMAATLTELRNMINGDVKKLLHDEVAKQVADLGKATDQAMRDAVARVDLKVNQYLELSLGTDAYSKLKGLTSIPDMIADERTRSVISTPGNLEQTIQAFGAPALRAAADRGGRDTNHAD
jgi:hypothetical protein